MKITTFVNEHTPDNTKWYVDTYDSYTEIGVKGEFIADKLERKMKIESMDFERKEDEDTRGGYVFEVYE